MVESKALNLAEKKDFSMVSWSVEMKAANLEFSKVVLKVDQMVVELVSYLVDELVPYSVEYLAETMDN